MKEDDQHIVTEELLFRYFLNEVSDKERHLVDSWKNESAENLSLYDNTYIFHLDMIAINSLKRNDYTSKQSEGWKKFKSSNKIENKTISINIPRSTLRYAAGLAFLALVGWVYFIQYNTEIINIETADKTQTIDLIDGSEVTLNKSSSLQYTRSFDKKNRTVSLTGEAYFKVKHNKNEPFKIKVNEAEITVLGTSFNVKSTHDSTIVHVDEGIVSLGAFDKHTLIRSGESAFVCFSSTKVSPSIEVLDSYYNFWRTKSLIFNDSELSDVIKSINKLYGSHLVLSNPQIGNCHITVSFVNQSLDDIMEVISQTLRLEIIKNGNETIIKGIGCEKL